MKLSPFKIVLVVVLLLVGISAFNNMHQVERTINEGPTAAVLQNDFYAAGKFLRSQGHAVQHRTTVVAANELGPDDTLLLTSTRTLTSPQHAHELLQWVYRGGNLIWEYSETDEAQPLAEFAAISARYTDSQEPEPFTFLQDLAEQQPSASAAEPLTPSQQVRVQLEARERKIPAERLSSLQLQTSYEPLTLAFRSPLSLSHPLLGDYEGDAPRFPGDLLGDAQNASARNLIQLEIGAGTMTVVSDAGIWDNDHIGLFDHAYSLSLLSADGATVYIQRYVDWPDLLTLLQRYAPETALVLLLLLVGWLLYNGRRFGPIRQAASEQRRSLQEHIQAVGQFHYRHQHHNYLLKALRSQIWKKATTASSTLPQMSSTEQYAEIARLSDLPTTLIERALSEQEHYNDAELVDITQLLIKIRNAL